MIKTLSKLFVVILCLIAKYGFSQSENRLIQQGNDQYKEKKFTDAEKNYKKSIEKQPQSFEGNYNLGNALYKQNKYEEASKQYMQAVGVDSTISNQSKSYFNLGNALVKSDKFKEGAEAYKMALRQNPTDENARYNLSYALAKLRQQEKENKDNKDQDKKDNKDQKKDQNQQKKDDQKKQDQEKKDQQKQDKQKQDQEKKDQQAKKQQAKPKISKEDAERILQALKNDEKNLQKRKAKKFEATGGNPEKDW